MLDKIQEGKDVSYEGDEETGNFRRQEAGNNLWGLRHGLRLIVFCDGNNVAVKDEEVAKGVS